MAETPEERIAEAQETIEILRRVHPGNDPAPETIAELHVTHAEHERKRGRLESARRAMQRAERILRGR